MSVIGRMDKQVEEVIIAPIARRHEQKNKEREQETQEAQQREDSETATEKEQSNSE